MSTDLLRFDGVALGYRRRSVFSEFSLAVGPGATLLLGPNGAGKSTLFKLAIGLATPSKGRVQRDLRCGYMPQQVVAMPGMTGVSRWNRSAGSAGCPERGREIRLMGSSTLLICKTRLQRDHLNSLADN